MAIEQTNWINGHSCGSGYDVYLYAEPGGRAAAMVKYLPTQEERYFDLTDSDEPESACQTWANGAGLPAESDEGAADLWDEMHAEYCEQD